MKLRSPKFHFCLSALTLVGSLQAAVTFTVSDLGPAVNSSNPPSTNLVGASVSSVIAAANTTPQITYTLNNVDLSAINGSTNETIQFSVTFSASNNSVAYNATNGNIYNGAGTVANQIETGEDLTATVNLVSTTFGSVALGFTTAGIGGVGTGESWKIVHANGTISGSNPTNTHTFSSSPYWTIQDVTTTGTNAGINLQSYTVTLNAVPEPAIALISSLGLLGLLRRRR